MLKVILNIAALIVFCFSGTLFAQDWAKVNPEMNSILTDTTLLRATLATIEPGKKSEMHTHPAHFFYALTDGKIKVHFRNAEAVVMDLKAGEFGYSNPEMPHETENLGTSTVKFLLIELKEHPYTGE